MSSTDDLLRLKSRLADIERENADRMSLIEKRAAKALEDSNEFGDKLRKESTEMLASLVERKKRAKAAGGWVTESVDRVEKDGDFGFEDDETENERRAGFTTAGPVAPPPPEPARSRGRHRHQAEHVEEEDYAHTDWLET